MQEIKNCSLCGKEAEKYNSIGQCPKCHKKGEWAKGVSIKGRDCGYTIAFQKMVARERADLFAELL
jgi:hypothetical protein